MTCGLEVRCSIQLSYGRIQVILAPRACDWKSAGVTTESTDLRFTNIHHGPHPGSKIIALDPGLRINL